MQLKGIACLLFFICFYRDSNLRLEYQSKEDLKPIFMNGQFAVIKVGFVCLKSPLLFHKVAVSASCMTLLSDGIFL